MKPTLPKPALLRRLLPLLSALAMVASPTLHAASFTAEGVASTEQRSRDDARREALQRALEDAGAQAGLAVSSREQAGDAPSQQQRITPRQPTRYRILQEWPTEAEYHVKIEAEFDDAAAVRNCSYPGQRQYRKTVASAYFPVLNPQHVSDIDNVTDGLPNELMRRLETSETLLPTSVARGSVFAVPHPGQRFEADRELVRRLAQNNNSQLVMVGRLLDASITSHGSRAFGQWQSDSGSVGHSTQYQQGWQNESGGGTQSAAIQIPGLPWNFGIRNETTGRRFEVEVLLYEGSSGILLQRLRVATEASGQVLNGRDKHFGSANFYQTDFGQSVGKALDEMARQLNAAASCLPFSARVAKVEGKTAYLDAGSLQNLRPGDTLSLFAPDRNTPIYAGEANIPLGLPEQPLGSIVIKSVQPKFAVGEVRENAGKRVRTGDTARYDEPQPRPQPTQQKEE